MECIWHRFYQRFQPITRTRKFRLDFIRSVVDLSYKIHGSCTKEKTPILVLHGLLGSKRNWYGVSKVIASTLKTCTVVVDARNHGQSPHVSTHTYPELAADVSKLMETLQYKKAIIIGHSMGGRTAMLLGLTEPDKIERLIIVDISPVSSPGVLSDFFPRLIDVLKTVNFEGANNINQARNIAKEKIIESKIITQMEGMNFLLMNIGETPDHKFRWNCNLDTLKNSFDTIASFPEDAKNKQFNGPTLFIGGQESKYLPPDDFDAIKLIFPNCKLKYIPNVGHNVHAEDPNTFTKIVNEFLSE